MLTEERRAPARRIGSPPMGMVLLQIEMLGGFEAPLASGATPARARQVARKSRNLRATSGGATVGRPKGLMEPGAMRR